jgi:hypothetical protein
MTIKTKSIKVSERAHQQLKMLAAKYDARIWAVVDMAIVAFKVAESDKRPRRSANGKGAEK